MTALARRAGVVLAGAAAVFLLLLAAKIDRDWLEVHILRLRCVVQPGELRLLTVWRSSFAIAGVAMLVCALALARRHVPRVRASGLARSPTLSVSLAAVLAIAMSDLVLRPKSHAGEPPPVSIGLPPVRDDDRLGWVYEGPRTTVLVDDGRSVMYAVNGRGDRVHSESADLDPSRPTILFAGESVTFGLGVHWEETYAARVGERLGVQIVNVGVHGYGDDQIRIRTLQRLEELRRPVAVVTLVLADLVERDVFTWRDRLGVRDDGSLFTVPPQPAFVRRSPLLALIERIGPWQSTEAIHVARAIHSATARDVKARRAYPLFVLTNYQRPCMPDATGRPSIEGRLFDGLDVDHIRVDLDPEWIVRSNGHPDARAHARIADAIARALSDAGVLRP